MAKYRVIVKCYHSLSNSQPCNQTEEVECRELGSAELSQVTETTVSRIVMVNEGVIITFPCQTVAIYPDILYVAD